MPSRPHPIEWLKAHPVAADVILATIVAALMIPSPWYAPDEPGVVYRDVNLLAPLLMAASSVPLVWRRRSPMRVLLVVGVAAVVYEVLAFPSPALTVGVLVALYTVGAHCRRVPSRLGLAFTLSGVAIVLSAARWHVDLNVIASNAFIFITVWVIGDNLQTRRAYVESLRERARVAEETRAAEAERAVIDERNRIARELHDVVAHSVSVMVVQAGAGRRVIGPDPERALQVFETIETTGRDALNEMRRLLGMLRDDDAPVALVPQPSLSGLRGLVEQFVDAGLPVDLVIEGDEEQLPAGVELSAYRIVQEALTNSLKHAGPSATVEIVVRYRDEGVEISVVDDGRGVTGDPGDGHGLVGMQERVDVFDGELKIGPRPGGGFEVRATLPTQEPVTP
ncbi:sensor histidine kinase [Actinospongicola halichondriae]|uniref:sensor histidine kinase n=1 Tax=Actinospongicola halichondriae TaxID=3236844 RepID=UPI003D3F3D20